MSCNTAYQDPAHDTYLVKSTSIAFIHHEHSLTHSMRLQYHSTKNTHGICTIDGGTIRDKRGHLTRPPCSTWLHCNKWLLRANHQRGQDLVEREGVNGGGGEDAILPVTWNRCLIWLLRYPISGSQFDIGVPLPIQGRTWRPGAHPIPPPIICTILVYTCTNLAATNCLPLTQTDCIKVGSP